MYRTMKKKCILVKDVTDELLQVHKPILKWVGGKSQICDKLIVDFPTNINNYHEMFLGGCSVLLTFLTYVNKGIIKITGNIYAHDSNKSLINVYKNIQNNHKKLYDYLQEIIKEYEECDGDIVNRKPKTIEEAKTSKESYYYWSRMRYNNLSQIEQCSILGSALFIFLNKTCFRGVFRTGPNGFNVPYGNYTNTQIIDKTHLLKIHKLIKNVIFEDNDFAISFDTIDDGDFIYLDPPYAPESKKSFVGYNKCGFDISQHKKLFNLCNKLSDNTKMMLSNADVDLVRQNFSDEKFTIDSIICKRSINSKNPNAKTKEVIIKNY